MRFFESIKLTDSLRECLEKGGKRNTLYFLCIDALLVDFNSASALVLRDIVADIDDISIDEVTEDYVASVIKAISKK